MEFSGCVEEYPIVHQYPYIECRDQTLGAYDDGIGTAAMSGNWTVMNSVSRYNYQDGWDFLHAGAEKIVFLNSQAYGNDGQAFKIGSAGYVLFENNLALDNCARILQTIGDEPASAIVPGVTACRAGGDWVPMQFARDGTYVVRNNTLAGYGSVPFDLACAGGWATCTGANTVYQNNVLVGISSPGRALPTIFYQETQPGLPPHDGWAVRTNNVYWNTKYQPCPGALQAGEFCADPMFSALPLTITAESDLDNVDLTPLVGSPLTNAGASGTGIAVDMNGIPRPNPPSISAMEGNQ